MADFKKMFDTPDTTSEFDPKDINDNKLFSVLCYLGILIIIPLATKKDSKFTWYHANQGLVLIVVDIIVSVASGILSNIPLVGGLLGALLSLALLAFTILGIVNVCNGKAKELPLIGGFKLLK